MISKTILISSFREKITEILIEVQMPTVWGLNKTCHILYLCLNHRGKKGSETSSVGFFTVRVCNINTPSNLRQLVSAKSDLNFLLDLMTPLSRAIKGACRKIPLIYTTDV